MIVSGTFVDDQGGIHPWKLWASKTTLAHWNTTTWIQVIHDAIRIYLEHYQFDNALLRAYKDYHFIDDGADVEDWLNLSSQDKDSVLPESRKYIDKLVNDKLASLGDIRIVTRQLLILRPVLLRTMNTVQYPLSHCLSRINEEISSYLEHAKNRKILGHKIIDDATVGYDGPDNEFAKDKTELFGALAAWAIDNDDTPQLTPVFEEPNDDFELAEVVPVEDHF